MNYFVVGDIHGCVEPLENLLAHWNKDEQQLIQLGDMVDRGPNSLGVLKKMMKIKKEHGAIILKGNHEAMFLDFLEHPENEGPYYFDVGGFETVQSFLGETPIQEKKFDYLADYILTHHADVVEFIRELPLYYEQEQWVFVHAGVNFNYSDWKSSTEDDYLWIRGGFVNGKNYHPKTFVFGHTPTRRLHTDQRDDIWVSPCGTKIGIDGACVFGGQLNALAIKQNEFKQISIKG